MPSDDEEKEWFTGDRVFVPRITDDESITLKIVDFIGDEDDPNPVVKLLLEEIRPVAGSSIRIELVRGMFRFCRLADLQDVPTKITKGGAIARMRRGLVPVKCQCGCGQDTSGGMFKQGHDAKLKSRLRKIMDGRVEDAGMLPSEAMAELSRRGWLS